MGRILAKTALLLAMCGAGPACAAKQATPAGDGTGTDDSDTSALISMAARTWNKNHIEVCLKQGVSAERLASIREGAERWQEVANLMFVGFGACGDTSDISIDVRSCDGPSGWSALGSDSMQGQPSMCLDPKWWSQLAITHEFGHALSFAHEETRKDSLPSVNPASCAGNTDIRSQDSSDLTFGAWDKTSIMNVCNNNKSPEGNLSPYDVRGAQATYGVQTGRGKGPIYVLGEKLCWSTADDSHVNLAACNQSAAQMWTNAQGSLMANGACLQGGVGGALMLASCALANDDGQSWTYASNQWRHQATGKCVTIEGGEARSGANLVLAACSDADAQKFGNYSGPLRSASLQTCITGSANQSALVTLTPCTNSSLQKVSYLNSRLQIGSMCIGTKGGANSVKTGVAMTACKIAPSTRWVSTGQGYRLAGTSVCLSSNPSRIPNQPPVILQMCDLETTQFLSWDSP